MARITPLSGFPEWLPHERLIEQHVVDTLRSVFELHGFAPIETRSVEPLDQLLRKGETDKEIYVLRRLQADADDTDAGLGLHFDLTVPFARYVLERAGHLEFPFRRYQIQKAWRGERPQEGRYREFLQADIDVVDRDELSFHYEVELPLVIADALARLPVPPVRIQLNNRKVPEGFYRGLGIDDVTHVLRTVDKLAKVGRAEVVRLLVAAGCSNEQAEQCLALAEISASDASFVERVQRLGVAHPLLDEGLDELTRVVEAGREHAPGLFVVDLSVARGLDYYTGTVYETLLTGHEHIGSICSGGRYDALASDGSTTYPGVGLSLGVTRLLGRLFGQQLLAISRKVPTCVLVALPDEESRPACRAVAAALRDRGVPAEVAPAPVKFGKQIRFAERRGIPFVWFPQPDGGHEIRDIRSGEQGPADPRSWSPPPADLHPVVYSPAPPEAFP
ncbi:MAG TPA: histidine--tRNA ligase [Mycobacteriales bacterium]|nr:histidine--tRNA ligase [Mycobacteriales bacterium]